MEPKEPPQSRRFLLLQLALSTLIALLLLPCTRYLFQSQLQTEFFPFLRQNDTQRYHNIALQRPDDYALQLADALNSTAVSGKYLPFSKRERLQELARRFLERPSVYANMLRFMTMDEVASRREEEFLIVGEPVPQYLHAAPPKSTPENLATFEDAAVQGERLDPTNAYFPLMRSVGLFAARRDAEAMQEIHRAAQASRWDDYCQDENLANEKMSEAAFGERPALHRLCQTAAILFPHYARIRAAVRIAAYNAIQEEMQGSIEEGFAIRADILRIGNLIRSQSPWAVGCNAGIAITDIGLMRPGGAPLVRSAQNDDFRANLQSDAEACAAYFQRIGHTDKAAWLQAEVRSSLQAQEIIKNGETKSVYNYFSWNSLSFIPLWLISSLLPLANIVTLLALGGIAYVLLWMRSRKVSLWQRSACFVLFMGLLACWQCRAVDSALSPWFQVCRDLGVKELPEIISNPFWFSLGCFAIPILLLGVLIVIALFSRVPLHLALTRGMRHLAVPVACLLVLAYGGLMAGMAYQEHRVNNELNRLSQHEGKYFAELVGKEWPGR